MVDVQSIRTLLLDAFDKWGLPKAIRTDNGEPFGVPTRDVVPILSLWLAAWGILPVLNQPKRPTQNSRVENNQRTSANWAEVYKCTDADDMQRQLDEAARCQRDIYKVRRLGNASRSEVFADLYNKPRKFDHTAFNPQLAYDLLETVIYPRKVSSGGTIAVYSKPFSVGIKHKGKVVFCKFSAKELAWLCFDGDQNLIKTIPDQRFSKNNLFLLTVYQ